MNGGPPATRTSSLNCTVTLMRAPSAYAPSASGEVTLDTDAPDVSTTMPLAATPVVPPGV